MLIRSCVLHYELELIHPFSNGNGCIGRLWHTLLISRWNPVFAWFPVESMIHARQHEYYAAINASNNAGESTVFVEFMLSVIKATLIDVVSMSDGRIDDTADKNKERWVRISAYLKSHEMNKDIFSENTVLIRYNSHP